MEYAILLSVVDVFLYVACYTGNQTMCQLHLVAIDSGEFNLDIGIIQGGP